MANYRKSFNLRNGVQVDDDNFIVNANGLVGIGTSIPTEFLDVRGNVKVVGLTTTNTLYAGIATINNLKVNQGGAVVSGVVTATSFSGSAAGLTGIYAIATDGWYINSTNSSISTSFKVGIATTNPQYSLQIGQDPLASGTPEGISFNASTGDIRSTGDITASTLVGSLNSSNLTGTIDNARLPSSINVGIITATTGFYGNLTGTASTANSITSSANIQVNSVNSGFSTSGISTVHTTLHVPGNIGVGTINPNSQIHIRKSGISSIQLTSDGSNSSIITFGRNVNLSTSNAQLRFGNTNGTYPSSTEQSLDIINYDTGNLNFYLNPGGSGTGSYNWFRPSLGLIMTLTSTGNLGINSSSPSSRLSVIGNATISGVATVGILTVNQNANINTVVSNTVEFTGSSSGYSRIVAPASAGNNTLTLPTSNGTVGQFLKTSGSTGLLSWSSAFGQIITETYGTITTHTTTWGSTGLGITITPASTNSKIVVLVNQPITTEGDVSGGIRLNRKTAGINTSTLYQPGNYCFSADTNSVNTWTSNLASLQYVDSPSSTDPITYFTESISSTVGGVYSNCSQNNRTTFAATSQIIVIELL